MWFVGLLCAVGFVPAGGVCLKWSVHITHTWFPLVPEIPYATACLATFAGGVSAVVMGAIAAGIKYLWD